MSFYTYNGETDFLEWYKNNYDGKTYDKNTGFSRPEEMSDAVWAAVSQLYNSYSQGLKDTDKKNTAISNTNKYYDSQKNSLLANYSTNLNALDESKQRAQENASITLDKLKKYLPTQMKMQGLGGLGVSESSALQAYNNYMNQMGDISAGYDTNKTTLATEKTSAENNLEKYRIDDLTKINNEYDGYERTRLEEGGAAALDAYLKGVETEQGNNFIAAKTYIESYSGTDAGTLEKYITDTYSGKVSDFDFEQLKVLGRSQVAKNVENANKIAAEEKDLVLEYTIIPRLDELEANGEWDKALSYLEKNEDNFTNQREYEAKHNFITDKIEEKKKEDIIKQTSEGKISIKGSDGEQYRLTKKLSPTAKQIARNNDFKKQLSKLGYLDPYSPDIPDGTTLKIKGDNNGSNDFNFWDDIGAAALSPLGHGSWDSWFNNKTWCLTYYNGEWYLSENKV